MESTTQQPTATPLQHLLKAAISAHNGTSFSPEKRGQQLIKDYEELLITDLEQIKEASAEAKETYQARFIKYLNAWLSAKSRIVSTMIAGGSNFPVKRMQKYNNWEDNAYKAFTSLSICRAIHLSQEPVKPPVIASIATPE